MFGPCFVMQHLVSFLVLQSEKEREREREREREDWLLYINCVFAAVWLILSCVSF